MRIGEIAEKTGLSISNIRFYEKKGLIGPDREAESKYRNYTEEDLLRLKQIILYRKIDFSVETIGKLLKNEIPVEDALKQQMDDLKVKQQMIQGSIDLCQKMIEDQAFEQVDVDYYIEYVKEEEANGKIFAKIDDFLLDFSDFTQYDQLIGGSLLGWWLFSRPWMNRAAMTIWCGFFLLVPVIGIVEALLDQDGVRIATVVFWGIWSIFLLCSFVRFQKRKQ